MTAFLISIGTLFVALIAALKFGKDKERDKTIIRDLKANEETRKRIEDGQADVDDSDTGVLRDWLREHGKRK